jgi:hypothetical protein
MISNASISVVNCTFRGATSIGVWIFATLVPTSLIAVCCGTQADAQVDRPRRRHEKMAQALLKVTPAC